MNNVIFPVQLCASVLPTTALRRVKFTWRYLYKSVLTSEEDCIRWLASYSLIPNERTCPLCDSTMVVARHWTYWRCQQCKKGFSVRRDTIFQNEQLPFMTIIELLYWWTLDSKPSIVCRELEMTNSAVSQWFQRIRKMCERYYKEHPCRLGGNSKDVEVNEWIYGSSSNAQVVMGIVERGSSDSFFTVVPDRSAETLLPIIEKHVRPSSRIITDNCASYVALPNHAVVNRSLNFVNPNDRTVHTNTIEGVWRHMKDELVKKKKGFKKELLEGYLREIQWRRLMGEACFAELLHWLHVYRGRRVA